MNKLNSLGKETENLMDLSMKISMVMSLSLRQLLALYVSNAMHDKEEKLLFIVFLDS